MKLNLKNASLDVLKKELDRAEFFLDEAQERADSIKNDKTLSYLDKLRLLEESSNYQYKASKIIKAFQNCGVLDK